nr:EAL domain-containing protein [uncultured Sulfurimonas sp.]
MKSILKDITDSSLFIVSLVDKDGEFLVGYNEVGEKILDYSWSRYLLQKADIRQYAPRYFDTMLHSSEFTSDVYNSKKINSIIGTSQELTLILKVKELKIQEIKDNMMTKMFDTLLLVLLISGPVGLLIALIPSLLATKVYNASRELKERTVIFDEYLEAMNVNNIISKSDTEGRITFVNENFCRVSGYTEAEVIGKPHSILRNPDEKKETFKILWLTIKAGKTWKGFLRNIKKDGGFYDVDIAIMPILNLENEIVEFVAIRHEITELVSQRKEILTIATKDPLSDVGNRYKLSLDIQNNILNNIAIIDIDNFSGINDFYGHTVGDEVIIKFSKLLLENLTNEFELYRLHSDKFAIHNYTLDSKRFSNFITQLNTRMIESVIDTEVESFDIVCTAGISSCDNDIIISTAEIANKYAKKINKKVLEYSKELNIEEGFAKNITWTKKVKQALHDDRIIMHYQPIVDNKTKKISKYEALVRLVDENGVIISPFHFLEIAKSSGQYIDITKVVIAKSFAHFENDDAEFSINLTMEDILDNELNTYLDEMIDKYKVANRLVLEIVESEGIEEFDTVQKFIYKMKNRGCKIAIDDFGTGYSNFEYLIKLDADFIKVDGSMIKNINHDENMKEIVKTIIDFAKKMNFKTIAEFVSSKEILDTVEELGIDYSQGYYLGIPSATTEKEEV